MRTLLTISFLCIVANASAVVIFVAAGSEHSNISHAVKMARVSDTIIIKKGIYKEGNITITKSIALIGDGAILDGENKYEILTVSANNVIIKGITFRYSGKSSLNDLASIKIIDASGFIIEDNTINNAHFAIHISNCRNFIIRNNTIKGTPGDEQNTGNGIHLWQCEKASITANIINGHRDGIYFEFVTHSQIVNNYSTGNIRYGLHFMFSNDDAYQYNTFSANGAGVAVMFSHHIKMTNNRFSKNIGAASYGLLLKEISDGEISFNHFAENTIGVFIEGSNRLSVTSNNFIKNGFAMRMQASCNENSVDANNFIANTFDVSTNGSLMLNKLFKNYWDKYEGYDLNKDGTGDVPYRPVSLYSMIIETTPVASMFLRSFIVNIMDRAEKALPVIIPEQMKDDVPVMHPYKI